MILVMKLVKGEEEKRGIFVFPPFFFAFLGAFLGIHNWLESVAKTATPANYAECGGLPLVRRDRKSFLMGGCVYLGIGEVVYSQRLG